MIAKDAVKVVGDNLEMTMTNVISPISIDEIPPDVLNYLEMKIDNDVILDGSKADVANKMQIKWEDKIFTMANLKDAVGLTLPVGGLLTIIVPNVKGIKAGETHNFEVTIKADNPINIAFEREVA